jgi:hypothetical protein
MYYCTCGDTVPQKRWQLGYKTCLNCGERRAREYKHCIVPMAKSNYQPVTDLSLLKSLNKYSKA